MKIVNCKLKISAPIVGASIFAAVSFPGVAQAIIAEAPSVAEILTRVLEFFLSIAGAIALLSLVASGIMYMVSGGDEGRASTAKRWIQYSVTGLVVVLLSYAIVKQLAVIFGE